MSPKKEETERSRARLVCGKVPRTQRQSGVIYHSGAPSLIKIIMIKKIMSLNST